MGPGSLAGSRATARRPAECAIGRVAQQLVPGRRAVGPRASATAAVPRRRAAGSDPVTVRRVRGRVTRDWPGRAMRVRFPSPGWARLGKNAPSAESLSSWSAAPSGPCHSCSASGPGHWPGHSRHWPEFPVGPGLAKMRHRPSRSAAGRAVGPVPADRHCQVPVGPGLAKIRRSFVKTGRSCEP